MTRLDWLALSLVTCFAGVIRVVAVGYPRSTVLDEYWYARDGCYYWRASVDACGMRGLRPPDRDATTWLAQYGELTPEHPPLGKWLIGAPTAVLGYSPGAWRLASVLAGALTVALLYVLVRRSLDSVAAASGAAGLLAIDYPHFIHSRVAMLEVFVALFAVAAFCCCVFDREQVNARADGRTSHHWWRLGAGLAAGAATACKLTGAAVVAGVIVLTILWEVGAARRAEQRGSSYTRSWASIVLLLLAVPVATYALTFAGRIDGSLVAVPWADGSWIREWLERQWYMVRFHTEKPSTSSSPWALPMTVAPLAYVLERAGDRVREVLLFGNPFLWWGGFAAVVYALVSLIRRRRTTTSALVVVAFLSAYVGWLVPALARQNILVYYAVPVAPFLYFALAYGYVSIPRARLRRVAGAVTVALAAAAFAFYWPILTGRPLESKSWKLRACSAQTLWLERREDCGLEFVRTSVRFAPRPGFHHPSHRANARTATSLPEGSITVYPRSSRNRL